MAGWECRAGSGAFNMGSVFKLVVAGGRYSANQSAVRRLFCMALKRESFFCGVCMVAAEHLPLGRFRYPEGGKHRHPHGRAGDS